MKYEDLIKSQSKYGIANDDILNFIGFENILENVIIAPWWRHEMFEKEGYKIDKINDKIFNFYGDNISFSFLEIKNIGASAVMDFILALGLTKCKNIIFLGSCGSLDKSINIGDIVIPEYSICGDGASRYLNKNLEDEFLKKEYPTKKITDELIGLLKDKKIKYHYVPNFSVDNIFAQFFHIDKIMSFGAKTIEMETANLFKCCEIMNINVSAIFCISDNALLKKTLYGGRTEEEHELGHSIRYNVIPSIVVELLNRIK